MLGAPRSERGLSESVSYALIWPLLMLVTLGVIQAGIWIHGRNVALRAAAAGADAARGSYGSAAEATEIAHDLAAAGGLQSVSVVVRRRPAQVDVTVSGRAPVMLDLGLARISEMASAPVERITPP